MQLFAEVGFLEHPISFSNWLRAIGLYLYCPDSFRPINSPFVRARRRNKALMVNLPAFYQTNYRRRRKRLCTPEQRSSAAPGRLAVYRL
jgi:hypothetical protein